MLVALTHALIPKQAVLAQARSTRKAAPETDKGIPLAPSEKDLKPWYSAKDSDQSRETDEGKRCVQGSMLHAA